MALAVDVIDRRGPSNEMRRLLKLKKTKVTCIIRVYNSKRCFNHPQFLTRRAASVLKVGVSI